MVEYWGGKCSSRPRIPCRSPGFCVDQRGIQPRLAHLGSFEGGFSREDHNTLRPKGGNVDRFGFYSVLVDFEGGSIISGANHLEFPMAGKATIRLELELP